MIPPTQVNKSMSSLEHFRSRAPPPPTRRHRAARCVLAGVCLLAVGALAAGGAVVVREYALSRPYSPGTCRVANVTYAEPDVDCTFCEGAVEKGPRSSAADPCVRVEYPCVRVLVEFVDRGGRHVGRGLLFDDSVQATHERRVRSSAFFVTVRAGTAYRKI